MYIYLIFFSISCLFFKISENKNKIISIAFIFLAILIPCLLAGFRADTIGTDVRNYVKPLFELSIQSKSFYSFYGQFIYKGWQVSPVSSIEIGYLILTYSVTKIFGSFIVLKMCIQFFIIFPIYIGLRHFKGKIPVWFGMLVFYLMFYNESLNMVRQWIAMAILIMGTKYLTERMSIKFFLIVLLASLFHATAVIGIPIYLLYGFLVNNKTLNIKFRNSSDFKVTTRSSVFNFFLIFLFAGILVFSIGKTGDLLSKFGLAQYSYYVSGSLNISLNQIIARLPIIIILGVNVHEKYDEDLFYFYVLLLGLVFSQLASLSNFSIRMVSYLFMYNIISFPLLSLSSCKKKTIVVRACVILYLVIFWYYFFVIKGDDQTVPYVFLNSQF
ncbi:EpsG family protein [Liquorilactobacillus satsumensis]|uniref:EpsG family protein n=2 Tax=Lactobacillaceae TaxID=33958 RepID=UPI001E65206C|nr:EpsG family protein [Liquorilactobacillus satsumensis]MCC7667101.1 hypothetical protein [Liquorilactobacillus satsumensis]MCP9358241.1 EpsG family protein [Liquorilactobacillus satsumensis]MCP9372195.1 EpsG family protein [Liquorilactobacillus satsumensis]